MADPLSITTGILTLLSTIGKTTVVVAEFVKTCREARRDLLAVSQELSNLKQILEWHKDDTEESNTPIPDSLTAQILPIISSCRRVLERIQGVVEKHSGRLGPARWALDGKKEVSSLRGELAAYTGVLNVTLEMVTIVIARDIKDDTAAIRDDTAELKLGQEQLELGQQEILAKIVELQSQLPLDIRENSSATFVVQRYLDSLTTYAESVIDDPDKWSEANHSRSSRESSPARGHGKEQSMGPNGAIQSELKLTPALLPLVMGIKSDNREEARFKALVESRSSALGRWSLDHVQTGSIAAEDVQHKEESVQDDSTKQTILVQPQQQNGLEEENEHIIEIARTSEGSQPTEKSSYNLPEDGSPVTINTRRKKKPLAHSEAIPLNRGKSQTSLLLEYFEEGKRDQYESRRPSVRVKVTPSLKAKSRSSAEHIQISERKRTRKPSYTQRIPLNVKSDQVPKIDDTDSNQPYGSAIEKANAISRSNEPIEVDIMPRHGSSLVHNYDLAEDTSSSSQSLEVPSQSIIPQTPSNTSTKQPLRLDSSEGAMVARNKDSFTGDKSGDKFVSRSGSKAPSINNPKLLATVQDAISRLILPELAALKREQSKHENRRIKVTDAGNDSGKAEAQS